MKRRLLLFFLFISSFAFAQNNIYRSGGIAQTVGAPTFTPGASGNIVAIDTVTGEWYVNPNRLSGASWISAGYRLTNISGSVPPAYTPTAHQSHFVVNAANQLYYWNGSSWQSVGGGGGSTDALRLKFIVVNKSGGTLNKGDVVYVSGAQGNRVAVKKALASVDSLSANTLGVIDETVANNGEGYCVAEGLVSGINTSAFTEGAALYLSASTAGAITQAKTTAPDHLVLIGYCVKSNAGSGEISVHIQNGYELGELHDVYVPSPTNGQVLTYNTANSRWEAATVADQSATNEIQTIDTFSLSGQTLRASLSSDAQPAKTVTLPVVNVTAGTGISISSTTGNYTVTNSAPDQTVSISNGGGITPSGTYPSFTLTATDQSVTNEIQRLDTFSLSGQALRASLLNDGVAASSVTLPIVDVVAGTNVTVTKSNGVATVSATGGGGSGTVTGTGVAGRAAFWRSTSAISSDANFAWDSTNVRLNIGAPSTPTGRLNVKGTGTLSSTINTRLTNSNNTELFRVNDAGSVGIGGLATSAALEVNRGPNSNPSMFLQNTSTTVSDFTGVGFNPTPNTNTCAMWSTTGVSLGGFQLSGFTSSSAAGAAAVILGHIGNSTPTSQSAVDIAGFKWNGGQGRSALSGNEIILNVSNGSAAIAQFRGGGNVNIGSSFVPGARVEIRGAGTTTGYSLLIRDSGSSNVAMAVQDNLSVGIRTSSIDSGAAFEVDGTTGGILFPRLTTTQRDALTPTNGLVIYNSTSDKLQVYAGGAWVDLH